MGATRARRLRRRVLAGGLLGIWAAVLAVHVDREYGRSEAVRLGDAALRLSPTASYYAVTLANQPVGFAASMLDTLPDGFRLTDDFRLFVEALGMSGEARLRTEMELSDRLELRHFRFLLDSELGRFEAAGAPEGDSVLQIRVRTAGEDQETRVPIEGPIVLPALLPLKLILGGEPQVGKTYDFSIFDPSVLDTRPMQVRIVARERLVVPDSAIYDDRRARWVPAAFDTIWTWRVQQTYGGVNVESWLDPDGQVIRATSPLGYAMERTAFEMAWNNLRALAASGELKAGAPDIIERTAVGSNVAVGSIARLTRLGVRIRNVELEGFDLSGARQRLSGDTLWIRREDVTGLDPGYTLPAERARFSRELAAEPLVQAGDPAIRATAERLAAGSRDPVDVAHRLNTWVYENVQKQVTLSLPSARQVLDGRRGDCNEHTVLYVALARALGLPARTATGLVYVRDRFYYHAWPEVWLGDWVAVDPTFGQFPADAAHLRFVVGGLADQIALVRLIGRVQLDVVDEQRGGGGEGE